MENSIDFLELQGIGVMAKTLNGYWSGHSCLVGVAGQRRWGVDN